MGASESSAASSTALDEARSRLTQPELDALLSSFSCLTGSPSAALCAEPLAHSLPPPFPWARLHARLVVAVEGVGEHALPAPSALSYAGLALGLARTVRARQSAAEKMRFWRSLYTQDEEGPLGEEALTQLLRDALHASRSGDIAATTSTESFEAVCAEAASLDAAQWSHWAAEQLPTLHAAFEGYVLGMLCGIGNPENRLPPSAAREPLLKHVLHEDQLEGSVLTNATAWLISLALGPAAAGEDRGWRCLYSSSAHGLALSRFAHHAVGYGGPTLLLARCAPLAEQGETCGLTIGAIVDTPWKAGDKFFGGNGCALVQLSPRFHVYRPTGHSQNFAFFNLPADRAAMFRARGEPQLPEVVAFGGQTGGFRLCLEDDLNFLLWHQSDTTYRSNEGEKLSEAKRRVNALELWGFGGIAAEEAQAELLRRKGRDAAKAGSLSLETRRQMAVDDHATRFVLEAGGAHHFVGDELKKSEDREARGINRGESIR